MDRGLFFPRANGAGIVRRRNEEVGFDGQEPLARPGDLGKTFMAFAREQKPMATWRPLKLGRNPVTLLELVLAVPLVAEALSRIDSIGTQGRKYPLSVVVRWLFMMPLCHQRHLQQMEDRLLTDELVKWAILGNSDALGEEVRDGIAPSRSYISKQISDHLDRQGRRLRLPPLRSDFLPAFDPALC